MHMLWGYKVQMNIPFHVLMARITNFSSKPLGKDEAFIHLDLQQFTIRSNLDLMEKNRPS